MELLQELHPEVDFQTQDGLIENRILDSFDLVTLVSEIADEYDVRITAAELIPENFESAASIYRLIQSKLED